MSGSFAPHGLYVACQAPLSMVFPRQEYWNRLPFLSSGQLPDLGIEPASPAVAGRFFITEPPGKPSDQHVVFFFKGLQLLILFIQSSKYLLCAGCSLDCGTNTNNKIINYSSVKKR